MKRAGRWSRVALVILSTVASFAMVSSFGTSASAATSPGQDAPSSQEQALTACLQGQANQGVLSLAGAQACAPQASVLPGPATQPGTYIIPLGNGFTVEQVSPASAAPALAQGWSCTNVRDSLSFPWFMAYGGNICWNGGWTSAVLNYGPACIGLPGSYCYVAAYGPHTTWQAAGQTYVWVNFAGLVGVVPECIWPRTYVHPYGGYTKPENTGQHWG
jgi:hypothetical protein